MQKLLFGSKLNSSCIFCYRFPCSCWTDHTSSIATMWLHTYTHTHTHTHKLYCVGTYSGQAIALIPEWCVHELFNLMPHILTWLRKRFGVTWCQLCDPKSLSNKLLPWQVEVATPPPAQRVMDIMHRLMGDATLGRTTECITSLQICGQVLFFWAVMNTVSLWSDQCQSGCLTMAPQLMSLDCF